MLKVNTETGSIYMFDMENLKMQRVNDTGNFDPMRQDGEWIQMLLEPTIEIGKAMKIALAPLGDPETTDCTMRFTSYVTKIEEL